MILVHTSEQEIAKNIKTRISNFLSEQNKLIADFMEFVEYDLKSVANIARSMTRESDIKLTILLRNWGLFTKPYKAVYGAISAVDLANWHDNFGEKLFIENVRLVIEKSDVNESILETAEHEPQNFWYFNNGITAICDSFHKQPIGGNATDTGNFDIDKLSVINGAQTIGTLAKALAGWR